MILIGSLYINYGGGLVLLNYLIENLNNCKKDLCKYPQHHFLMVYYKALAQYI